MTWTLRRILILIVALSAMAVSGTLVWVTETYEQFAVESQNEFTAATVSHLVQRQIRDQHQRKVHPFIDEWARLSTLVKGMKESDPERARLAANRMMLTLEVVEGRVRLRNVKIYDKDMAAVSSADKGSGESVAELPELISTLVERDVRQQRQITSFMWRSKSGRPLFSTIAPIGGFQVAGFVEFVTDPVPDLEGIQSALKGQFGLNDVNGEMLVRYQNPDFPVDEQDGGVETLNVPIFGALGKPWATATLTRNVSKFHISIAELRDRALIIVAAVLIGSTLFAWLMLKLAVFGRLKDFSKAMQVLASGDTNVSVPDVGPDELLTIRNALLSLRDAVSERREANIDLRNARIQAEEQAKLQRVILDNVGQGIVVFKGLDKPPALANELAEKLTGLPSDFTMVERANMQMERLNLDEKIRTLVSGFNKRASQGERDFMITYQRPGLDAGTWTQVTFQSLDDGMIVQTYQDITDLREALETARNAQHHAEEANRAKSEFLSNMSHELRTPLNAIIGFTEFVMVNEKESISENQRDSLSQVLKAGRHLLTLIDDILDLAKIEASTVALSIEAVEPSAVVDECVALTASYGAERNVSVWNKITETPLPSIDVDRTRFKQVLLNLLSNAIKYNSKGGKVIIERAPTEDGMLKIGVRDDGPGIPEDQMVHLFDPFDRLGAENSAIEGTGIGLTITKRLVDNMGGEITVDSVMGKGSTFWVEFPLSNQVVTLPTLDADSEQEQSGTTAVGKILYVEDNPANLDLVRKIFGETPGIVMVDAPTGELGLERARAERPNVILIDINLQGINGYDVLETLRAMPETEHIPVIALSDAPTEAERKQGEKAGFFGFLAKPVATAKLTETVEKALEISKQVQPQKSAPPIKIA